MIMYTTVSGTLTTRKRMYMRHRCFIKIYSKYTTQELSDTAGALTDNFSKYMDSFIAQLPARILEHRKGLELHEEMTKIDNIFVSLAPSHSLSRLPDILLEVIIDLSSNGQNKRRNAEKTFNMITEQHFERLKVPNFTVETFVNNRA